MDVLTNGVSIGGANIQAVTGDCFKKVAAGNNHEVTWNAYLSWPDQKFGPGVVSVRMTAWALDNTPDYMAVDISAAAQPGTQTYYPSADFVPGGVTNSIYKTTKLLMRKIMAKDVEWTMGSTTLETKRNATREATHQVKLDGNYYIGVYRFATTRSATPPTPRRRMRPTTGLPTRTRIPSSDCSARRRASTSTFPPKPSGSSPPAPATATRSGATARAS